MMELFKPFQGKETLGNPVPRVARLPRLPWAELSNAFGVNEPCALPYGRLSAAVLNQMFPLAAHCSLLTAHCLLVSARETAGGPYQPSMTLIALTAFFS